MAISSLHVSQFRNLTTALLEPCQQGINVIYGCNGSGKTSLLEAIHYIGSGKSFRSGTASQLIQHQTDKFTLFAQLLNEASRQVPIGVERDAQGGTRLKVAENDMCSMVELAQLLPLRVINTHSHHLFESGPVYRRKFLDWGLFYQSERFLTYWRQYERALKQRNAILKDKRSRQELDSWTEELAKHGLALTQLRQDYLQQLLPFLTMTTEALLNLTDYQVDYYPGWDESEDFRVVLTESYIDEYRFGYTQAGPHRADMDILVDGIPVKHFLSRGQQKLMVCAMILAQGMLLAQATNRRSIYLVDDLPAELDKRGRQHLVSLLLKQASQVFVTAIEKETMSDVLACQDNVTVKMFHVEHGKVSIDGHD